MKRQLFLILVFCYTLVFADESAIYSELWGAAGEKWSPTSRLPDFTYAGYFRGEKAIPFVGVRLNVKDFGALGDGVHDDSDAFIEAIAELDSGAIFIPEGRYKITKILRIKKSNVVLRGAGADKSILFFPMPLNDIEPNWGATTSGRRTSNYSWAGGFVYMIGGFDSRELAEATAPAQRGDFSLHISSTEHLGVGQEIEIFQHDNSDNSLARHIYSGDPGNMGKLNGSTRVSLVTRITRIDGERITFDRPLRFDVSLQWQPLIRSFEPAVTQCGVENVGFEFPNTPYEGHFTEMGYNPIAMSGVAHCWVRNIHVKNCDSGLFISGKFCTLDCVVFESERKPDKTNNSNGHHGIILGGDDNIYSRFNYQQRFIHDITVSGCGGNVIMDGRGDDLCFDHHKRAPYENLFTNINAGKGTRLWKCGGGRALGRQCAARGTFWNIRAVKPQKHPGGFGPWSMNLVALTTDEKSEAALDDRWFEAIEPEKIWPRNIYEAQFLRREASK